MDALPDALDIGWRLLEGGAVDRRSPVHTPVVASVDADGAPDSRVMVLRAVDRIAGTLRFHTDARSPKCAALDGRRVSVLAYHPGEAVQLRLAGMARVVAEGADVDAAWAAATVFARRCYLAEAAPGSLLTAAGSGLPAWAERRKPEETDLVAARRNFALVIVQLTGVDWLHLAEGGHRRARFSVGDGWLGEWMVP